MYHRITHVVHLALNLYHAYTYKARRTGSPILHHRLATTNTTSLIYKWTFMVLLCVCGILFMDINFCKSHWQNRIQTHRKRWLPLYVYLFIFVFRSPTIWDVTWLIQITWCYIKAINYPKWKKKHVARIWSCRRLTTGMHNKWKRWYILRS